jgi:hypothetical protein
MILKDCCEIRFYQSVHSANLLYYSCDVGVQNLFWTNGIKLLDLIKIKTYVILPKSDGLMLVLSKTL